YESFAYLLIFIGLYAIYKYTNMKQKHGAIFGLFLVLVFSARIAIESVKVSQAAYHESMLSAGQWLSLPFLFTGIVLLVMAYRKRT
ncbi:prolipoprotein diacylglyceryl transferase, partial [Shewanella sp. SR41-2]|nr:prolipoprotein diacylglyceryl transferase [Shewanella sp. SR41-2]